MARQEALIRLHKILMARRAEILRKLQEDMDSLRLKSDPSSDYADAAFDATGDDMMMQLAELDSRELEKIDRALQRLKQGTYGICESCSQKIPIGRLNALPYSTLCIECQREMEQYPGNGGRVSDSNWEKVYDSPATLEDQREIRISDLDLDLPTGR
jgi:DnaK suppressor protein